MLKKIILVLLTISASLYSNTIYQKACDRGNAKACYKLGTIYESADGVKQDLDKAKKLYKKACDEGYDGGCFKLACDDGNAEGCFKLGAIYERSNGGRQDLDKAKKLYKKACDGNIMDACASLQIAVAFHPYTEEDYKIAVEGLTKACNSGAYPDIGCFTLFTVYLSKHEMDKAKKTAKKGCDQGSSQACSMFNHWDILYGK